MRPLLVLPLLALFVLGSTNPAEKKKRDRHHDPHQVLVLDGTPVHDVGELLLHASNWGELGSNPGVTSTFEFAPSAEWPANSGVEHLFAAGLWVGALKSGVPSVSTASFEREFRPTQDPIDVVYYAAEGAQGGSRLPSTTADDDDDGDIDEDRLDGHDNDGDSQIDEDFAAISNQMLSRVFRDDTPAAIAVYPNHNPMGLEVTQETYQWEDDDYDDFIGIKYVIENDGLNVLEDIYVGIFIDGDVGNRNTPNYFEDDAAGYVSQIHCTEFGPVRTQIAYFYDVDGDNGTATSYLGVMFIDHPIDPTGEFAPKRVRTSAYVNFTGDQAFEEGGDPTNDFQRYEVLSANTVERDALIPRDYRALITVGPFAELVPGQSMEFHAAVVAGDGLDGLLENAKRAALVERGEWFDLDFNKTTGTSGNETGIAGPAGPITVNECDGGPEVPFVPAGTTLWTNRDCAEEGRLFNQCGYSTGDSLLYLTGVDGKETEVNWRLPEGGSVPVFVQSFTARARGAAVQLDWEIFADEEIDGFRIMRASDGAPEVTIVELADPVARGFVDRDVEAGREYAYALHVLLPDGSLVRSGGQTVRVGQVAAALDQNHPNPFNPDTRITFALAERGRVRIEVFDAAGRLVRTLVDRELSAGPHGVGWDARDRAGRAVGSGVYFYRMTTANETISRKMVVVR